MEHIKRIKNLLRIILVCTLVLLYSSCYTDLTYGTREHGRINATKYSNYQTRNLRNFSTQKHRKLVKGKHGRLYHEFMRPYKNNGKITRQRLLKYHN